MAPALTTLRKIQDFGFLPKCRFFITSPVESSISNSSLPLFMMLSLDMCFVIFLLTNLHMACTASHNYILLYRLFEARSQSLHAATEAVLQMFGLILFEVFYISLQPSSNRTRSDQIQLVAYFHKFDPSHDNTVKLFY